MKLSARNQIKGKIEQIKKGAVNSEITLSINDTDKLTSIITNNSVENLQLKLNMPSVAIIKASSIILAKGADNMKTSARNNLKGVVSKITIGSVNSDILIQLKGDSVISAIITNTSVENMNLSLKDEIQVVFKASSVILGIE